MKVRLLCLLGFCLGLPTQRDASYLGCLRLIASYTLEARHPIVWQATCHPSPWSGPILLTCYHGIPPPPRLTHTYRVTLDCSNLLVPDLTRVSGGSFSYQQRNGWWLWQIWARCQNLQNPGGTEWWGGGVVGVGDRITWHSFRSQRLLFRKYHDFVYHDFINKTKQTKKYSAQGRSLFRAFFSLLFRGCFSKLFFFVACKDKELRNWFLFLLCILLRKQLMDKSMQPFLFSMRTFSLPTYECFFSCLCVRAYVCMCYSLWSLRHQVILLVMDCVIVKTFFMLLSTH